MLAKVEQSELAGATAGPTPGGLWLSLAQDSETPSRAWEGALKPHPRVSLMLLHIARALGLSRVTRLQTEYITAIEAKGGNKSA